MGKAGKNALTLAEDGTYTMIDAVSLTVEAVHAETKGRRIFYSRGLPGFYLGRPRRRGLFSSTSLPSINNNHNHMTTSNKCNHALEIAEDMYNAYADGKDRYKHQPMVKYADLPDDDKAGWLNVAEQALPIIGNHALGDIRDYLGVKASGASTWWKKVLLGLAYAAVGALGFSLFQGCGHSVDVTPEKDGGMQRRLLPSAGTGAYLLQSGPAGNGCSAHRANHQEIRPCVSSPKYRRVSWILPRLPRVCLRPDVADDMRRGMLVHRGEVVSHHNDRLCDLMTMQTQAQVETAKAIQLLAVRIENIERKLEK